MSVDDVPIPTAAVEIITPEYAKLVLDEHNINNRPMRGAFVERLKHAIDNGEWELNGESIKFDVNGRLLDGQHRMSAIELSGQPVQVFVVRGLPPEVQDTIDIGQKRNVGQALAMRGITDYYNVAAVARVLWQYENKHLPRKNPADDPTPTENIDFALKHQPIIANALTTGRAINQNFPTVNVSIGAVFFIVISRKNKKQAAEFVHRLCTGENLPARHPILMLSRRLMRDAAERRKMNRYEVLAVMIKAWNAVREDRPVDVLGWKRVETFPRAQ